MNPNAWEAHLKRGLDEGAYPCYAAAVGKGDQCFFRAFGGNRAVTPSPLPLREDTLFDMASLSKLMGTTMAALRLIMQGKLRLTDALGDYFPHCYGKERITIHHLMTHVSGIPAHLPLWTMGISPQEAAQAILQSPLALPTGTDVIYSCMGYILLGRLLESICAMRLDQIVTREVFEPLGMQHTVYCPAPSLICAATEQKVGQDAPICGHVHDENAHFLGGVSGNAGVFSELDDVICFASMLSRGGEGYLDPALFSYAIQNHTPGMTEARGLGFQLCSGETYPGGSHMTVGSYGHTGFTGTSLYVDRDSGVYCILLSNRVHFGRNTPRFFEYRRAFYDLVFANGKEGIR